MSAIALLAAPEKLVGFLLLSKPDATQEAPCVSDCIFTGVPSDASLLAHELGKFVQEQKDIEHQCQIEKMTEGLKVIVNLSNESKVVLLISQEGRGSWRVHHKGSQSPEGLCELA